MSVVLLFSNFSNAITTVRVGEFPVSLTHVVAYVNRYFDNDEYEVKLHLEDSGGRVIAKLDNNELDIAALGSAPFAVGASRGVPMTEFAVIYSTGKSEGLVARNGRGISSPRDLLGKHVATIGGSTVHFHMDFIIQLFQLDRQALTIDYTSPGIAFDKWQDGTLDAVFCWGLCLATAQETGKMLVPSAYLNSWGKETFLNIVARNGFMQDHPAFVQRFVDVLILMQDDFVINAHAWVPGSFFLESMVDFLDEGSFPKTDEARQAVRLAEMKVVDWIGSDLQNDCQYIPAPGNSDCPAGGQAISTRLSAQFSFSNKVLVTPPGDNAYYSNFVSSEFLLARDTTLTMADMVVKSHTAFTVGDTDFCVGNKVLEDASGSFSDGHGTNGGYQDLSDCSWTISVSDSTPVLLSFPLLSVERGHDIVTVYKGSGPDGDLMGYFTGRDLVVPDLATFGPVHLTFTSDSTRDQTYKYPWENGFNATYSTSTICTTDSDCGANGNCQSNLCSCNDGYFGAFCDTELCTGTTYRTADSGIVSGGGASTSTLPNNADCRWVISPSGASANEVVELVFSEFVLDDMFDFVKVYDGDGVSATLLASFTGYSLPPSIRSTSPVVSVQFVSDSLNKSTAFQFDYSLQPALCSGPSDCSNNGACESGACACDEGYYGSTCSSEYCLGSAPIQTASSGSFRLQNAARTNYNNLASCDWQLEPAVHPSTGDAATGALLFFTEWDVELSDEEVVEVWDVAAGEVVLTLSTASSTCLKDDDCGAAHEGGSCVRESEEEVTGECVCNEGFVNRDCSMGGTVAHRAEPVSLSGQVQLRVSFSSDFNNPEAYAGFALDFEGVYPCPTNSLGVECAGQGECRLGECVCAEGNEGVACQVNAALCTDVHQVHTVSSCSADTEKRRIEFAWTNPLACETIDLPPVVEIDCDMIPSSSSTGGLVIVLAIVGAVVAAGFAAFVLIYQKRPVIRFAQKPFCLLFCLGAGLSCISLLAFLGANTDSNCLLRPWLFHLSLTFMFGSLFVKLWRVWRLFDNKAMKKLSIPNKTLYWVLARLLLADVVMLVVWSFWTPPERTEEVEYEPGVGLVSHVVCSSEETNMSTLAVVYKSGLILYGCFLAFKTRNVDDRFSEAKPLFAAIYNLALVGGLTLLLTQAMDISASSGLMLQALGTVWCSCVSLAAIFVPKMMNLDAVAMTSSVITPVSGSKGGRTGNQNSSLNSSQNATK